ncbi:ankyrin repeat domain-containing protein [Candidatus Dependentiae bacterium]
MSTTIKGSFFAVMLLFLSSLQVNAESPQKLGKKLIKTLEKAISLQEKGQTKKVKAKIKKAISLIHRNADVNYKDDETGNTPLILAIDFRDIKLVTLMLQKNANPNQKVENISLFYPIALATSKGDLEIIRLLVEHGADVNVKSFIFPCLEATPLIITVQKNDLNGAKYLLENGASLNIKGKLVSFNKRERSFTALEMAIENKNTEMANLLIKNSTNTNYECENKQNSLMIAVSKDQPELVEILLKNGAKPKNKNSYKAAALFVAALKNKSKNVIKILRKHDIVPDIIENQKIITKLILKEETEGCCTQNDRKNITVASILLRMGTDKAKLIEPILLAAYSEHFTTIRRNSKYLNLRDSDSKTVLIHVCEKTFKEKGAYVRKKMKNLTIRPLGAAVAIEELLNNGANPNLQDNTGKTALIYAVNREKTDLVDFSHTSKQQLIEALLTYGANPNIKDKSGKSAMDYAKENGDKRIIALLQGY